MVTFSFTFDNAGAQFTAPIDCRRITMRERAQANSYTVQLPDMGAPAFFLFAGESMEFDRRPHSRILYKGEKLGWFVATAGTISMVGIAED